MLWTEKETNEGMNQEIIRSDVFAGQLQGLLWFPQNSLLWGWWNRYQSWHVDYAAEYLYFNANQN